MMKCTHEIVGTHGGALLLERAPGACSRSKTPCVYRTLREAAPQKKTKNKEKNRERKEKEVGIRECET